MSMSGFDARPVLRALSFLALAVVPAVLAGQGVTTAAVQGRVVGEDGSPIVGARVHVVNIADGRRWEVASRPDGRFLIEGVAVGSYRVEVRALGFSAAARDGIVLTLGERLVADFTLQRAAIELSPVTVRGTPDPVLDRGRTGPAEVIPRSTLAALPNLGRGFLSLTLLSPQAVSSVRTPAINTASGIAFDGQNRVYNSFQIDGGVNHDLYRGQLPGRESFPRPLSLEALEEIQILVAPFDVRHGGFVGGLVNAVTRSGSNDVHGSLFGYLTDAALVRRGGIGDAVGDFRTWQFGGTLGGPIVRDRAHYFLSVDMQQRVVPDPGPLISDTAGGADLSRIGISYASAVRFRDIMDTLYGLDVGRFGPVDGRVPAHDVFGKLTTQLATNSHLDGSYHYVHGNRRDFLLRSHGNYYLSSYAQQEPSTSHAARLGWTSLFASRWSNELLVSYMRQRDFCRPGAAFPEIRVFNAPVGFLAAGTTGGCGLTTQLQDALEITNNATLGIGRHVFTIGTHGEFLRFRDDLVSASSGLWEFDGLDALEAGRARRYQRTLRGPAWDDGVDFRARLVALYGQDRWSPTPALTLTLGLRLDVPFLPDAVPTNESLKAALGVDTGRLPSGNVLWSPRLGVNYDVGGVGRTFVRGGIGLFSGRPPYRWISNAYRDDGTQELFLDCRGVQAPQFDPTNQPTSCVSTGPQPRLSFFDPDVRFPQNLKVALGLDHHLLGGLVGTVDVLFTRAVHQLYVSDANLAPPLGTSHGEGNRPLYGTINASTGAATPARLSAAFGPVVRVSDRSGDHALSISTQLRTRIGGAVEGSALYAYTRARDRMSIAHIVARAMLEGTIVDGTLENRRLGTSLFEIPHRVQLTAGMRLPYNTRLGLLYSGASGRPFTYTVSGDANADGMGVGLRQDPAYVPRDRADITMDGNGGSAGIGTAAQQDSAYALLDSFIEAVPCLRAQRGRILARNSCRNAWFGTLNARVTKAFPAVAGHSLEVSADVYNVLNLINSRWGLSQYDGLTFATDLVVLRGYDTINGRGIYEFRLPPRNQIEDLASRWQTELSVRYVF
jgi:hypothetical protein